MTTGRIARPYPEAPFMPPSLRRFAAFYFCYYAALGAYTPYIGRWVDSMGHGGYVVSAMLGLWYASRIVAPPLWSALLQKSARPGYWFVAINVTLLQQLISAHSFSFQNCLCHFHFWKTTQHYIPVVHLIPPV